jgi:hypothetical protein
MDRTNVQVLQGFSGPGHGHAVGQSVFEVVCHRCLAAHDLLESAALPARCPACGADKPWVGPIVDSGRFEPSEAEALEFSPLYFAAASRRRDGAGL